MERPAAFIANLSKKICRYLRVSTAGTDDDVHMHTVSFKVDYSIIIVIVTYVNIIIRSVLLYWLQVK